MKKTVIVITILLVGFSNLFAQTSTDSIRVVKGFGSYQFYKGDKLLTIFDLTNTLKTNETAYKQIRSAQPGYLVSMALCFTGAGILGWNTAGYEPNWPMVGISAGILVISYSMFEKACNEFQQSVNTYNRGLKTL